MNQAFELVEKARAAGVLITTAESCTGGMVAAAITDIPGASDMFERGYVTYSNTAKIDLLGVSPDTLTAHGAVSEEVAREMAQGARARAAAALAVAITGIAGPGGSDHKPEGRVCFAIAAPDRIESLTYDFGPLGRIQVREKAKDKALQLLLEKCSR